VYTHLPAYEDGIDSDPKRRHKLQTHI